MTSIGDRIKTVRKELGLSQSAVAERAGGLKYQTIQDLENGSSKSSKHLMAIARALQVRPEWLETGDGSLESAKTGTPPTPAPLLSAPTTDLNIHQMPRDLRVLGGAVCGEDGLFEFNGQVLDYVRRPPRLLSIQDAYAVYAAGDSMSPWREMGDLVYVHPHQPVKVGDYVVVQLHPESDGGAVPAYIKKLVRRTNATLQLLQYNPRKEISIPTKRVWQIHKVVDWSELMGL